MIGDVKAKALSLIREEQMLGKGDSVLVAVSGGADSMCLLSLLLELQAELGIAGVAAAHVNHGLRGEEADRDEELVRAFCKAHDVPFFVRHADVAQTAKEQNIGLEEAGRAVRYAFFEEIAAEYGYSRIATAHTHSDAMETVLLHMVRGTGIHGLCGIPPVRGKVIRPLLSCVRGEIETYCAEHTVPFVADSTNNDTQFARNRVRNCIVPELYTLNPQADKAFARLMSAAREDEAFWQEQTACAMAEAAVEDTVFSAEKLQSLPPALCSRTLQRIVEECAGVCCERQHIARLKEILTNGGAVTVAKQVICTVKQGYFTVKIDAPPFSPCVLTPGTTYRVGTVSYRCEVWDRKKFEKNAKVYKILLQYTCDYDKLHGVARLRTRKAGDRYSPFRRGGHKSLKKWFNAERIPAAKRDFVPLVEDDDGIALVVGMGCDKRTAIDDTTKNILVFY